MSKRSIVVTIFGNWACFVIFLITFHKEAFLNPFALLSLCTGIGVAVFYFRADLKNPLINRFLFSLYTCLLILELVFYGVPTSVIPIDDSYSKGALFTILMNLAPLVYAGLRIALVYPLLSVLISSIKLSRAIKENV